MGCALIGEPERRCPHFCGDRAHARQSGAANAISDQNGLVRTEQYGYDELSRLTSVDYGDGQTQSYTFDPMGNRTGKTDSVNGNDASTFNAANMLLTKNGQGYTYDANGNTLTGGGRTNSWDSANRLTQIVFNGTTTTHTYGSDGLRRRTVKGADTTDYILDGDSVIRTLQNGVLDKTYFHGLRGPEYERTGAGNPTWYVYDGLGSVVGLLDVNGSLVSTRKYDVYGSVRGGTGISGSKHKFVGSLGHPSEDDAGLIYMRARWMDPTTGTFASEDPARDGGNWFGYVADNPICYRDKSGKERDPAYFDFPTFAAVITLGVTLAGTTQNNKFAQKLLLAFLPLWICIELPCVFFDIVTDRWAMGTVASIATVAAGTAYLRGMDQVTGFYATYSACIAVTMLILGADWYYTGPQH